jgi:site-specific recombinase XerD
MKTAADFAPLLEQFFTKRLMAQRQVSSNTVASYRDTFRLLLVFAQKRLNKAPATLSLLDIDAALVDAFLDDLEKSRGTHARSRNLRLSAIRSFFNYAAYYEPTHAEQIQQVLAIPNKKYDRVQVGFLTRPEVESVLAAPDMQTWIGRRDHALLLMAFQCGLRLSELTGLRNADIELNAGAHVRCIGKGRKERCTPLAPQTVKVLKAWFKETPRGTLDIVFPTVHGRPMSADAVQYLVAKHVSVARQTCPSLKNKRVSPHMARHTAAMELLLAGIDPPTMALWLGHESIKSTQVYLDANLALKEAALAKTTPFDGRMARFKPKDSLLEFLRNL